MAGLGVWAIFAYVVFVFYAFFSNIGNMDETGCSKKHPDFINDCDNMQLFSGNLGNLAGTAALAFTIHTNFGPMIKCNRNQEMNFRDLKIVFIAGFVIYTSIGLFGAFGILNRGLGDCPPPSLITDYFGQSVGSLIVQLLYFMHLVSVLPVFFEISRARLVQLVYKNEKPPTWFFPTVNVLFMVFCTIIKNIPNLDPSDITNFNGSICCFFFVYLIPIALHFACYHEGFSFIKSLKRKPSQYPTINNDISMLAYDGAQTDLLMINDKSNTSGSNLQYNQKVNQNQEFFNQDPYDKYRCAHHDEAKIKAYSAQIRIAFYSVLIFIGLAVMIYGIYQVIAKVMGLNQIECPRIVT